MLLSHHSLTAIIPQPQPTSTALLRTQTQTQRYKKVPSEMEVAPRYKLPTLFILFLLFKKQGRLERYSNGLQNVG